MTVTLSFLREQNAYKDMTLWFAKRYSPEGADYKDVLCSLMGDDCPSAWAAWLFRQIGCIEPLLLIDGSYSGRHLAHPGPVTVNGNLKLSGNLIAAGNVSVGNINATGNIEVVHGDLLSKKDITAHAIRVGGNIRALACIVARDAIDAGGSIIAAWDIVGQGKVYARKGGIHAQAGTVKSTDDNVVARYSISAGKGVSAHRHIHAERGCILTGHSVACKHTVTAGRYIQTGEDHGVAADEIYAASRPRILTGDYKSLLRRSPHETVCFKAACPIVTAQVSS